MTRQLVPVETELGIASSRDSIYLDEVTYEVPGGLTLRGGLIRSHFSEARGDWEEIPYRLHFQGVLHLSMTTIDLHDSDGRQSCIDEDVDSETIRTLRRQDSENIVGRGEYHHWVVSTYDDIFEIVAASMTLELVTLRAAEVGDWPAILRVANEALPNAPDGNAGWLEARQGTDATRRRRHYVAEDRGEIVAYGAIEESEGSRRWRLFLVMSAARLRDGPGGSMLSRLFTDVYDLDGEGAVVWMREQADDSTLLTFVREKGFAEARRFVVRDGGAYDGVEVVEVERFVPPMRPTSQSSEP